MWVEITYPFPNFNGWDIEVWEWINNFIPHFTGPVADYLSMVGLKLIHVYKRGPDSKFCHNGKIVPQWHPPLIIWDHHIDQISYWDKGKFFSIEEDNTMLIDTLHNESCFSANTTRDYMLCHKWWCFDPPAYKCDDFIIYRDFANKQLKVLIGDS